MKELAEFDCLDEDLSDQVLTHLRQHLPETTSEPAKS